MHNYKAALEKTSYRLGIILAERDRLHQALMDAINSPKGVVPDSALEFYNPPKEEL